MTETEYKLLNWRGDSLNAERMCADILIMQDFESVDPQSPLGGPDGTKDILCQKSGWQYLAGVYFPPLPKTFNSIKKKFTDDYKGVKKNKVDGIIFMTNQKLTPTNKKNLKSIAKKDKKTCIIFDNESIRVLLDSGLGLPIRLNHLKIKLSKSDQIAFFSKQQNRLPLLLDTYSNIIIKTLSQKIDACCINNDNFEKQISEIHNYAQQTNAFIQETKTKTDKSKLIFPSTLDYLSTENLDSKMLNSIHKVMLYGEQISNLGEFRTHKIWIGTKNSNIDKASYIPPEPSSVEKLVNELLKKWNDDYKKLKKSKDKKYIIKKIAKFHSDFLSIHPFLDGNGRVARFLLNQQVSELLNVNKQIIIEDKPSYYDALNEGRKGNLKPLIEILLIAIYGTNEIE